MSTIDAFHPSVFRVFIVMMFACGRVAWFTVYVFGLAYGAVVGLFHRFHLYRHPRLVNLYTLVSGSIRGIGPRGSLGLFGLFVCFTIHRDAPDGVGTVVGYVLSVGGGRPPARIAAAVCVTVPGWRVATPAGVGCLPNHAEA